LKLSRAELDAARGGIDQRLAVARRGPGGGGAARQRRLMRRKLRQVDIGAHAEDAGVPVVRPVENVAGRGLRVGLLRELAGSEAAADLPAAVDLDVAVAGLRIGWPYAEGHDPAVARQGGGGIDILLERVLWHDQVIGRDRQQYCVIAPALAREPSRHRDRRRGVAPDRLQDRMQRAGRTARGEFIVALERVVLVGHQQHVGRTLERTGTFERGA
jgi:hypothetical protein